MCGWMVILCLISYGGRGDKGYKQTAGSWLGYTILLFLSGCCAVAGHGWWSFGLACAGVGVINKDDKKSK